jgi:light-regulated signal transduction histidine kinase (bacteriophytochrome)
MSKKPFDSTVLADAAGALDFITNVLEASTEYSIIGKSLDGTIQERPFQAFTLLTSSTTRRHEDTGLGLRLPQNLADLLGGRISFTGKSGKGRRVNRGAPRASA